MTCTNCQSDNQGDVQFCRSCGTKLQAKTEANLATTPSPQVEPPTMESKSSLVYATFFQRLVASIIDGVITGLLGFVFGFVLGLITAIIGLDETTTMLLSFIGGVILGWLYYAKMESSPKQATFGKALLGIKVTNLEGQPVSFGQATGRYFGKIISGSLTLGIGYLTIAFTAKKQGFHDMIAGTVVVKS